MSTSIARPGPLVVTALRSEYAALVRRVPGARLARCGMGPGRVAGWLRADPGHAASCVVVAGVAGGLDPSLRPGDVVVASEVRGRHGRVVLRGGATLVADLRALGLRVHHGPVLTHDTVVGGAHERQRLAATGALAVDMESAHVVHALARPDLPLAVVRVVVDTAAEPLLRVATLRNGARALAVLRRTGPALVRWATSTEQVHARERCTGTVPKEVSQ